MQMASDYTGVFGYPGNEAQKYTYKSWYTCIGEDLAQKKCRNGEDLDLVIGGGLQSTFSFGSRAPAIGSYQSGGIPEGGFMPLELPVHRFGLADAVGITSVTFAYGLDTMPGANALIPALDVWPIPSSQFPKAEPARKFTLGDGATFDDLAINANLQRKVQRVAVSFSTDHGDKICERDVFDFCTQFDPLTFQYEGKIGVAFACYFGYGDKDKVTYDYTMNTVFKKEDLGPLACILQKRRAAGEAAVAWK